MAQKDRVVVRSDVVEISAPVDVVWNVLIDLAKYPLWNPFNPSAHSNLTLGESVHMQVALDPAGSPGSVSETLRILEPLRHIAWDAPTSDLPGDLGLRDQYLEIVDGARCRYYQTDTFAGPSASALGERFGEAGRTGFNRMGLSLKARAEEIYAAR
jgi:hypothetical protein